MPLLLLRSAIVLRLWLARAALLASFFLRSWVVSRLCPWPRGPPATAVELSCRCLREENAPPGGPISWKRLWLAEPTAFLRGPWERTPTFQPPEEGGKEPGRGRAVGSLASPG